MSPKLPPDDFSWVPRYPAPLDAARVPEHLRDNPLVQMYLGLTPDQEAELDASARADEATDAETVAGLLAEAR